MSGSEAGGRRRKLLLALLVPAALSFAIRELHELRFYYPADWPHEVESSWFSVEPDGLYHLRRVERQWTEGMPPAGEDARLNWPDGAAIPWPPYYDAAMALAMSPIAPEEPRARAAWLERVGATLPLVFSALTSLLVAAAGARLLGPGAGLVAGCLHATAFGSVHYGLPGIADHHAWVGLLYAGLLLLSAHAWQRMGASRRSGEGCQPWRYGLVGGLLVALLLGSWVASLVYVLLLQLTCAWLMLLDTRRRVPGLAGFGFTLHATAALGLLPAVLWSPWRESHPWMTVNLSLFHVALLVAGALVFLPLPLLSHGGRARRAYPWCVGVAIAVGAGGMAVLDLGPARGVREGFEWVARANDFMAGIGESQPLLGADTTGTGGAFTWLGPGILFLPVALAGALWRILRGYDLGLMPFVVATPVLAAQALSQRRFADVLAVVSCVLMGWAVARLWKQASLEKTLRWIPGPVIGLFGIALAGVANAPTIESLIDRAGHRAEDRDSVSAWRERGVREAYEWLGARGRERGEAPVVLAHWDQGHALEWVAGARTVATNFGSYVGEEGFRAPARFFTSRDAAVAEAILERHEVDFVVVHSLLPAGWPSVQQIAGEPVRWRDSLAAQLAHSGNVEVRSPGFLRLVHVARYPELMPDVRLAVPRAHAAFVWEAVAGALLEVASPGGDTVRLMLRLHDEETGYEFLFVREARPESGVARLRVPYATDADNGDFRVVESALSIGETSRTVVVTAAEVAGGETVVVE